MSTKIETVVVDVDGTLTDGSMYYSAKGEVVKRFHTYDGVAVRMLKEVGVKTFFVTGESSLFAEKRAMKVGASCFLGVKNKLALMDALGVSLNTLAVMGDDVNDLELMKAAAYCGTPYGSYLSRSGLIQEIPLRRFYLANFKGGDGAFRDFVDHLFNFELNIDKLHVSGIPS